MSERAWRGRVGALLVGLGLVAVAEGVARVLVPAPQGVPALPSAAVDGLRQVDLVPDRALTEPAETGADGRSRARTAQDLVARGVLAPQTFDVQPALGVVRILAFGGSATLGVPFESRQELTFPGRLARRLQDAGLPVEVINLGGASLGSTQVLAAVTEALVYRPDAMVIYSGNNEFFQYGLALLKANEGLTTARSALEHLGLFRALRGLSRAARDLPSDGAPDRVQESEAMRERQETRVQALVAAAMAEAEPARWPAVGEDGLPHRQDPIFQEVVATYAHSLTTIADLAARQSPPIDLFLVEVPANLRVAPRLSLHRAGLSPWDRLGFDRAMTEAADAASVGRWADAEASLTAALAIDDAYALAWYRRGAARLVNGRLPEARDDLRAALELDFDPQRPPMAFAEVVRGLANLHVATRIDAPAVLTPDADLLTRATPFVDTCHLTEAAYDRLAEAIAGRMMERWLGSAGRTPAPDAPPTPAPATQAPPLGPAHRSLDPDELAGELTPRPL